MPLGNHTSSATCADEPSGRTTHTDPGLGASPPIRSKPAALTKVLPRGSTTISFHACPVAPYGVRVPCSSVMTTPSVLVSTVRPSGSQSTEKGNPVIFSSTRRLPLASYDDTSPATQSHTQSRPSCHRGDSPIRNPVAKTSTSPPPVS